MTTERYERAVRAVSPEHAVLTGVEVTHPNMTAPIRVINDTQQHVIGGQTFYPLRFEPVFPGEGGDEEPVAKVRLDNVGRLLTQWIDASNGGHGARARFFQITAEPWRDAEGNAAGGMGQDAVGTAHGIRPGERQHLARLLLAARPAGRAATPRPAGLARTVLMSHWATEYLADAGPGDCADLVENVLLERFGTTVSLPRRESGIRAKDRQVCDLRSAFADPVVAGDEREGDLLLMRSARAATLGGASSGDPLLIRRRVACAAPASPGGPQTHRCQRPARHRGSRAPEPTESAAMTAIEYLPHPLTLSGRRTADCASPRGRGLSDAIVELIHRDNAPAAAGGIAIPGRRRADGHFGACRMPDPRRLPDNPAHGMRRRRFRPAAGRALARRRVRRTVARSQAGIGIRDTGMGRHRHRAGGRRHAHGAACAPAGNPARRRAETAGARVLAVGRLQPPAAVRAAPARARQAPRLSGLGDARVRRIRKRRAVPVTAL